MTNANQNKVDWLVLLYVAADDVSLANVNEATIVDECNTMLTKLADKETTIAPEVAVVALTDDSLEPDPQGKYKDMTPAIRVLENHEWRKIPLDELDEETRLIFKTLVDKEEIDTGIPRTLSYFIRWALRKYDPTKMMLSIIGHGGGWSVRLPGESLFFHSDVERAGHAGGGQFQPNKGTGNSPSLNGLCPDFTSSTALSTVDLRDALVFGLNGRKLDVLFLDACLMGMIEVAYELRNNVHYLVAGQSLLWPQLPYEIYLGAENLHSGIEPESLAHTIVQLYNSRSKSVQKSWAISAINLERIGETQEQVERLAIELVYWMKKSRDNVIAVARAYHDTQQFDYNADSKLEHTESYVDIFDFAAKVSEYLNNNNNQPQLRQPDPASNTIRSVADVIRDQTGGRRFRPVNSKSGSGQSEGAKTILSDARFDPQKTVISSFAQTDEGEEQIIHVDRAYGLSIYFPMGELVDPIDDPLGDPPKAMDDQELKEALELRIERYTAHLSFAKASPNWVELLKSLPQLSDTNGDDLKTILLPSEALVPADETVSTDEAARKISRQPTWRRRSFYRPRQRRW